MTGGSPSWLSEFIGCSCVKNEIWVHKVQDNFVKEKSIITKQYDCTPMSCVAQIQTHSLQEDSRSQFSLREQVPSLKKVMAHLLMASKVFEREREDNKEKAKKKNKNKQNRQIEANPPRKLNSKCLSRGLKKSHFR